MLVKTVSYGIKDNEIIKLPRKKLRITHNQTDSRFKSNKKRRLENTMLQCERKHFQLYTKRKFF